MPQAFGPPHSGQRVRSGDAAESGGEAATTHAVYAAPAPYAAAPYAAAFTFRRQACSSGSV
jgi:hypothetical protein